MSVNSEGFREVKTFEGETLLDRFKSMEKDGITEENIIDFFGGENSKYLVLNMMGGVNEDEYREFYKYFSERHKLNQLFPKVFKENWDQDPVIIRVGKSLM
ncbi:MAG: hypothetical protein J6O61_14270 [Butyrivibrio sp.]|uniref:hypothetical protein n=1 Tax=Butyrivibrio sp. TaxID=28121 RepID=UPI001B005453|nr:hypothetical protein [Butyrivibrio sp.]MBO6241967.1 hypothetical protein [Butyrivibrio sp.]